MDQQFENITDTKQYRLLHPIDSNHIDTTLLPEVVAQYGKRVTLILINSKLNNSRFEVKFDFKKVKETLMKGEFEDLALFHHDFTVLKTRKNTVKLKEIEKLFDVSKITEDDTKITYTVSFQEGPYANTIDETVDNINKNLGKEFEKIVNQLDLDDYLMTFKISLAY
ncbi:hypothetical protein [Lysinibacillus endophyticus]|uniref:hypothetical protein n=1 Tax=Ureibacillus endophyticus TaxID=1978490 RepID=UPI00209F506F|nr:hypothetical protein [Lysinibacillus endophyticus]MCP1143665.1 hypothetical protein [Lysinibacillus endophyticus]